MKTTTRLILYLGLISLFSFFCLPTDKKPKKHISFEDAIARKMVSTVVSSLGGHRDACILITLKNISDNDTIFYLEPGRRFVSEDTSIQDILIVHGQELFLAAGEEKQISGFGFCCQASNGSPYKDAEYSVGRMADSLLVLLAEHIDKNEYPSSAIQGAVWVLSDNKPLSCINFNAEEDTKKVRKLQRFVAKLAGLSIEYAWYSIKYKTDTTQLFSGVPDSLYGEFDYQINKYAEISLVMYDSIGHVIGHFISKKPHNPDKYSYDVALDVYGWPLGNYYVRLFVDGQMRKERIFTL